MDVNSALIVEYESGALGMLETSFLSRGCPFRLELYGTEGTLLIEKGQPVRIRSSHFASGDWHVPELPASLPSPLEQWADQILHGEPPAMTHEDARALTLINQAAHRSHLEKRRVEIREITGGLMT